MSEALPSATVARVEIPVTLCFDLELPAGTAPTLQEYQRAAAAALERAYGEEARIPVPSLGLHAIVWFPDAAAGLAVLDGPLEEDIRPTVHRLHYYRVSYPAGTKAPMWEHPGVEFIDSEAATSPEQQ